jgi:hypothetical protein
VSGASLQEAIRELWGEAEHLHRPVVAARNAGISRDVVERVLGFSVPAAVATWFATGDGVAHAPGQTQDDAALVPGYEPLSVQEAADMRTDYGDSFPVLGNHWVPLLASGGGDFYAAVFDKEATDCKVVSIMLEVEPRLAFLSVEDMVRTFTRCYRDGVFFVNEEGVLDADDERWMQIEEEAVRDAPGQ